MFTIRSSVIDYSQIDRPDELKITGKRESQ